MCLVAFFALVGERVDAGSLTIAWDPNPEPDVAGYLIYYGSSAGDYPNFVDVHNATVGTVNNLVEGQPYFFVVIAYNSGGLQSERSSEVTGLAMPAGAQMVAPIPGDVLPGTTVQFQWTNASASAYSLAGGTTIGATNLFNVNAATSLSATVSGLPKDGSKVFVRLSSRIGNIERLSHYGYTAITCSFGLSSSSASAPVSGSTNSVGVTTASGCDWVGTSNSNWITVNSGSPGNGSGTVAYSTAANTVNSPRTGTLTIADQTFTVTQPAATRIISVAGTLNKFNTVQSGSTSTKPMTIANSGNSPLTVNSITYPTGYSGNWASGIVPPGGSKVVTVTFAPTAVTQYEGTIVVNADHTSGTNTIVAAGKGRK